MMRKVEKKGIRLCGKWFHSEKLKEAEGQNVVVQLKPDRMCIYTLFEEIPFPENGATFVKSVKRHGVFIDGTWYTAARLFEWIGSLVEIRKNSQSNSYSAYTIEGGHFIDDLVEFNNFTFRSQKKGSNIRTPFEGSSIRTPFDKNF